MIDVLCSLFSVLIDVELASDHPSIHYMIADQKEAMLSTMAAEQGEESPYLWTNENHLIEILQTNFEQMWHSSSSVSTTNGMHQVLAVLGIAS